MRVLRSRLGIVLAVLLVPAVFAVSVALAAPAARPVQEELPEKPPEPPEEPGTFTGQVASWDDGARSFRVRGASGNEMQFTWNDATTFDGTPGAGDSVEVRYTVADGQHVATHVSVNDAEPA